MNGDSYRLKQSVGRRRASARAEQNQATPDIVDAETGEITISCPELPGDMGRASIGALSMSLTQPAGLALLGPAGLELDQG